VKALTDFEFGPEAGLEPGFALGRVGTTLLRGHTPGRAPDWFGPAVGHRGIGRFDVPVRDDRNDVGTCYFAETLAGVIYERVLRGLMPPALSVTTVDAAHAITEATLTRDVILIDLFAFPGRHGLQIGLTTLAPVLPTPPGMPVYPMTQPLAAFWASAPHPHRVDGILYNSRFTGAALCVALWHRASDALVWGTERTLTSDFPAFNHACRSIGVALVP
jgi:hypothetical protein